MRGFRTTDPPVGCGVAARLAVVALPLLLMTAAGRREEEAEAETSAEAIQRGTLVDQTLNHQARWTDHSLFIQLLRDGSPAGPPFRLAGGNFWATERGYRLRRGIETSAIETAKPPTRAAPAGGPRLRIRLEDEKKSRIDIELQMSPTGAVVEARYRPSPNDSGATGRAGLRFPALRGVPRARREGVAPNWSELCAGMELEIVTESGERRVYAFADEVEQMPPFVEWTVRGLWGAWEVRGRMESRGAAFRYWQYAGTRPAQGFGISYLHDRQAASRRVSVEWVRRETASAPRAATPAQMGSAP